MCGIAGILHRGDTPVSEAPLRRMTDAIAHRGPDGEGHFVEGPLGLGHRRLAVIDLTPAGRQPMATQDGRFVIAYSGEVYNFRELRAELETVGRAFTSRSDTEVVLNAYAEWGEAALDRFNGMFAFAVWDREERRLFLARDRYGIKPLYYTQQGGTFLFGSEVKAILAHPAYRTELDRRALLEYFTFQNLFTDRTLFEGIRLLPAGHWLRLGADGAPTGPIRYWDFHFSEPVSPADEADYVEELDRLFRQAVKRQLVSDVEVGAYLSGGMDSGSISAVAATELPYIRTFTAGFDLSSASGIELGFDERASAERMSYLFKTEHYEVVLKAGDMERAMPRLAYHIEEPRVGQSYPNFYAAGARRQVRQGRSLRRRRRRTVRRLPVALLPGNHQRRLRALCREILCVLAAPGAESRNSATLPDRSGRMSRGFEPATSSTTCSPIMRISSPARRTTLTTRSILKRRPSCTASSWWRTS